MEPTRATPPERPTQPAATGPAGTSRPGAAADDQAPSGTSQGFALLLAALDGDGALPPPSAQDAMAPQATVSDADDDVTAGGGEICDAVQPPESKVPDAIGLATHLGLLLNQVLPALEEQGLNANSMVAETTRIDSTAPPQAGRVGMRSAGAAAARLPTVASGSAPDAVSATGPSDAPGAAISTRQGANAVASGAGVSFAALAQTADAAGEGGRVAVRGELSSSHAPGTAAAPLPLMQALADAASVRSRAAPAAQTVGEGGAVAAGDAGVHQSHAPWAANGTDAATALAQDAPAGESFMEQLSEQVAFWVHQKTQRAELTLDRDGEAVRVHLTLTGDAAKITFLSDHAEARRAFDAGIDDLRAMLREQGLELAGVNVGVAAQQQDSPGANTGDGGKASSEGEGARQGVARVEVPTTPASAAGRSGRVRALDVFV